MPHLRETSYIWATWLARLLADESHCQWAGWFRAHWQDWTTPPSDLDSARWMLDHTALVKMGWPISRASRRNNPMLTSHTEDRKLWPHYGGKPS